MAISMLALALCCMAMTMACGSNAAERAGKSWFGRIQTWVPVSTLILLWAIALITHANSGTWPSRGGWSSAPGFPKDWSDPNPGGLAWAWVQLIASLSIAGTTGLLLPLPVQFLVHWLRSRGSTLSQEIRQIAPSLACAIALLASACYEPFARTLGWILD